MGCIRIYMVGDLLPRTRQLISSAQEGIHMLCPIGKACFHMTFCAALKKAAFLLMVKTNEVFALVMGHNPLDVLMEGELFFAEEWNVSKGEKVTNMAQLEALFDR